MQLALAMRTSRTCGLGVFLALLVFEVWVVEVFVVPAEGAVAPPTLAAAAG
jgi:hypothetical protein